MRSPSPLLRCLAGLAGGLLAAQAQNLLPNPRFAAGAGERPEGWRLAEGAGRWLRGTDDSGPALCVGGTGAEAASWRTEALPAVTPGLYALRFRGRRDPTATGGTALAGVGGVHRDFPLSGDWREEGFVFAVPDGDTSPAARLGQWHVNGGVVFADVALRPVLAAHDRSADGMELGQAESIRAGVYRFEPDLNWEGANSSRVLVTNRAGFNSNRWLFQPGAELVFRHAPGSRRLQEGRIRVAINYHTGGSLALEASREGRAWIPIGSLDGARRVGEIALPGSLFPAESLLVRLAQPGPGAGFQVDTYGFEGRVADPVPDAEGSTRFLEVLERDPQLGVRLLRVGPSPTGSGVAVAIEVTNATGERLDFEVTGSIDGTTEPLTLGRLELPPGEPKVVEGTFPIRAAGDRRMELRLERGGRTWFAGRTRWRVGWLDGPAIGHRLASEGDLGLWWCEGTWKVGRRMAAPAPAPGEEGSVVRVSLARGEHEPVQVVLRPSRSLRLEEVRLPTLRDRAGRVAPLAVRVDEVAYVRVTRPTDGSCVAGWYPDPLPPLQTPFALRAGENQPLWLTVHAPPRAEAGEFAGDLELVTDAGTARVPLAVTVYDFTLPRETHLRSALGLGMGMINRYHRLTNRADQVTVFETYLRDFAEHRISPYSFYDHAPMAVRFEGSGTQRVARVDFTAFDAAARRWLDEAGFNTFQLPLRGMGGGTFHERHLGRLEGFEEGTPEHARLFRDYLGQVERHLAERGWLPRAFAYWFDEPDPKDYAFVVEGMKRLKEAAPGLRRMLTEQPEPALLGHVDIWCGLTPEWSRERVMERRRAGEEVWWYICTGPKAPYVTEFIDHPGTELRLWPWQSWQYGVTGILVWATLYWTSPLVYPGATLQDPWQDPMSWTSGYGLPVGHRAPWGNGDGRFLYPPRRDPNADPGPDFGPPIHSCRWENLRDGMEDYEYLWMLEQQVRRLEGRDPESPGLADARALLVVPAAVSADLTHFTTDPGAILEQRDRIARAIERLARVP